MISSDPGSFRDPASRVVFSDGRVIRLLDQRGLAAWRAASATPFFAKAMESGRIVPSREVEDPTGIAAGALEHPRLPLITYPYEWTFGMLREAALFHLELIEDALRSGLAIKDATPFNVQFVDGEPVFIDIGSFEPYIQGEPWLGYRQFTRQFLFPLMMRSWLGVPFQPWLRGDPEGPTASDMRAMLGARRWRPAAMLHVTLQARLEARLRGAAVRQRLKGAGFNAELILANVRRLRRLVESLTWDPKTAGWTGYRECAHVSRDREPKGVFLREVLAGGSFKTLLDLGANDGHFSLMAAEQGIHVVAVDGDEAVLDSLHQRISGKPVSVVLSDLANPSPSLGWRGLERPGLWDRLGPDLVLAYGLIHHLIYTASIPPSSVLDWLRGFDCPVVVEYVSPRDEMVGILTANKEQAEMHGGRTESEFRGLVAERFAIASETTLGNGSRILFHLIPRRA